MPLQRLTEQATGIGLWLMAQSDTCKGESRRFDPKGLFQNGCIGGFKHGVVDGEA